MKPIKDSIKTKKNPNTVFGGIYPTGTGGLGLVATVGTIMDLLGLTPQLFAPMMAKIGNGGKVILMRLLMALSKSSLLRVMTSR